MSISVPFLQSNEGSGSMPVSSSVFDKPYNEGLVHQLITAYMSAARSGTKAQKTRSDVRGGGAKPWRQKGSGRARAGTTRGPLWRTGGVTFAANPRSYAQKLNKKMFRAGMRAIFSELLRQGRLVVSDNVFPDTHKTKDFLALVPFSAEGSHLLIVTHEITDNLYLSARNLFGVSVLSHTNVDPLSLVYSDKVVVTSQAIKSIEEWLCQ